MTWTVTIDNGSTFTDGCLFADGRVWSVKVLTTPYDLMRCFVEVFRQLAQVSGLENEAALLRRVEEVRYSTTSGTNALLVRKGVREWVQPEPPENVPYYGSWDNRDLLYLGNRSEKAARGATHSVMMPDPREVRIAELEQRLRAAGIDFQE